MNATVTVLHDTVTEAADPRETPSPDVADAFEAQVLSLEQPLMELLTSRKVERGAALRIDADDALWLGEAEECRAAADGYSVRVRLRHVLRDFETLARLAERFGAASPKVGAASPKVGAASPKGIPVQI